MIAIHFAFGLGLAGMLPVFKIQNFLALPFSPNFDLPLAFVAIGSLLPSLLDWITQSRHAEKPLFNARFCLPTTEGIACEIECRKRYFWS